MSIDNIVAGLNKKYKKNIIRRGSEIEKPMMIPFSSPRANYMTRGGIAVGKVTEFFGAEHSGKTTAVLDIIANYQKLFPDQYVVFLDAENTLDVEWGELLGVDFEKVIIIKPENEYGEMLLDMVIDTIQSGEVGLVVIDSIPFLMTKQEFDNDLKDKTYGGNSALMTTFARKLVPTLNQYKCTAVLINQLREEIGSMFKAYKTVGGRMLKHSYTQRIQFSKGSLLDENYKEQNRNFETPSGHTIQMRYVKNKITKNDRTLERITLNYYKGIDVFYDTIELALFLGIIKQGGAWYYIDLEGESLKFQGKAKLTEYLSVNAVHFNVLKETTLEEAVK